MTNRTNMLINMNSQAQVTACLQSCLCHAVLRNKPLQALSQKQKTGCAVTSGIDWLSENLRVCPGKMQFVRLREEFMLV